MRNKAWPIITSTGLALASIALWLFFRPLMLALGVWTDPTADQADFAGEYRVQLINAAYLLLSNGAITIAILACATLFGLFLLHRPLSNEIKRIDRPHPIGILLLILFALGLGLVTLSLATFLLGWAGLLHRWLFITILVAMAASGVLPVMRIREHNTARAVTSSAHCSLLMVLIPLAILALIASMLPAGILWAHDGRGYDALEYHLQLPREYLQVGRIVPFEHNVFSYLPANAEMLYLVAMILRGDHVDGMYVAQMINFAIAVAFVAGTYLLLRHRSPRAAAIAAIVIAGPQLFFVATNAYVECLMLFMFLLALCATPFARRALGLNEFLPLSSPSAALLAGIYTGAACGCKYTALLMVVPIVLLFLIQLRTSRAKNIAIYLLGVIVIFSPWVARNAIYARNPVFPLAAKQLGQAHWNDEQVERWQKALRPADSHASPSQRLRLLARQLLHPEHYGCAVLAALAVGLLAGRNSWGRSSTLCVVAIIMQLLAWMLLTHLQTRFLLPMLVPCALLIGAAAPRHRTALAVLLAIIAAATTIWLCADAYNHSTAKPNERTGFQPFVGRDDVVAQGYPFSDSTTDYAGANVLLLGEARPFYVRAEYSYNTVFDRCCLADRFAEGRRTDEILLALQQQSFTHLYVNWHELARLQRTYAFATAVDRTNISRLSRHGLKEIIPTDQSASPDNWTLYKVANLPHR